MTGDAGVDFADNFPFLAHQHPRPGQIDMIRESRESLKSQGFHLCAAPTGIGKTAASLAAAIEVMRNTPTRINILFLTGRQSQHKIVVDTIRKINDRIAGQYQPVKVVDIIGRESMCEVVDVLSGKCLCESSSSESSKFARREDVKDFILEYPRHVEEVIERGKVWGVCSWQTCRAAAKDCDVLICDYNHVFSESVSENSLPAMGINLENTILIIDEAHNLPDRIRMNMERVITPTIVRNCYMELEEYLGAYLETLTKHNQTSNSHSETINYVFEVIKILRRRVSDFFKQSITNLPSDKEENLISVNQFIELFNKSCDEHEGSIGQTTLEKNASQDGYKPSNETRIKILTEILAEVVVEVESEDEDSAEPDSHKISNILSTISMFGETSALSLVFSNKGKDGKITSHLLDPGIVSGPIFAKTKGAILMSGTLYPPSMYANLLSLPKEKTSKAEYKSPFAGERRPVLIAQDVTTKYGQRTELMWNKIRNHIQALIDGSDGHVAVFCPSYKLLDQIISDTFFRGVKKVVESRDWTKSDIDKLVGMLKSERSNNQRVLLCGVFGARLSEGIDYTDGVLDAVACIGIPNPPPSVLSESLKSYTSDKFGKENAWRYTVTQPAINSILQAMGRPIRSIDDRALILLLDKRNTDQTYARCYPKDMKMNSTNDPKTTLSFAKRFFSKVKPGHSNQKVH